MYVRVAGTGDFHEEMSGKVLQEWFEMIYPKFGLEM
jgi:hypothetical protein